MELIVFPFIFNPLPSSNTASVLASSPVPVGPHTLFAFRRNFKNQPVTEPHIQHRYLALQQPVAPLQVGKARPCGARAVVGSCFRQHQSYAVAKFQIPATITHPHSRAYLRHLFLADEMLGPVLLSAHNLTYYQRLLAAARSAIEQDRFAEFRRKKLAGWVR